jgi:hypothetical protein
MGQSQGCPKFLDLTPKLPNLRLKGHDQWIYFMRQAHLPQRTPLTPGLRPRLRTSG